MRTLNLIQFVSEILVALGFLGGLVPFGYYFSVWYVLPLTVLNLVLSLITKNRTEKRTITIVVMAVVSLIPIVGVVARVVGMVLSILNAVDLGKKLQ